MECKKSNLFHCFVKTLSQQSFILFLNEPNSSIYYLPGLWTVVTILPVFMKHETVKRITNFLKLCSRREHRYLNLHFRSTASGFQWPKALQTFLTTAIAFGSAFITLINFRFTFLSWKYVFILKSEGSFQYLIFITMPPCYYIIYRISCY